VFRFRGWGLGVRAEEYGSVGIARWAVLRSFFIQRPMPCLRGRWDAGAFILNPTPNPQPLTPSP